MRKITIVIASILILSGLLLAGGIVTNTNQSAAYLRTLNRNASTDIDAVYSNPAGITQLENGLHIGLNNQSIFQLKTVENDYTFLKNNKFEGTVTALVFPDFYVAYKKDKLALSAAFMPIGGGGSAEFEAGLPSFEMPVSELLPSMAATGVTDYRYDTYFNGSSIYFGGQAGLAYQINDKFSVSVGGRFVMASNTYEGHLKDIEVNIPGTGWIAPGTFMHGAAAQYTAGAASANGAASSLQAVSTAGYGGLTFDQAQTGGVLTADQVSELQGGLGENYVDGMTIDQAAATYTALGTGATATAAEYEATANYLDVATGDKEVDVLQKATGFAPVISANFTPNENLLIAFRYEGMLKLELENETKDGKDAGMATFADKAKTNADMPAMVGLGVAYTVSPKLKTEASFNYYMNTGVNWDGKEDYIDNGYEAGLSVEYALNEKLKASLGFLNAAGGAQENYQTDLSYSLNSNTIGLGFNFALSEKLNIDFGALNTFYAEGTRDGASESTSVNFVETYNKTTMGFAFGLNLKL